MKWLLQHFTGFFFRPVSGLGMGLMRVSWGLTILWFFLSNITGTTFYYSESGILPMQLARQYVLRGDYRFTLLDGVGDIGAWSISMLFVVCLLLCVLGIWPRLTTIASFLLLCGFHERNILPLAGGDTVLRSCGFILSIAPGLGTFGLNRLPAQWREWRANTCLLPPPQVPMWAWRLTLWQLCVIYLTSGFDKTLGTMWLDGTAPSIAWHHHHFMRFSYAFTNWLSPFSYTIAYGTILFELSWVLLLIPGFLWRFLRLPYHRYKRWLLLGGVAFHGSILVFMTVGSFPAAMLTFYFGLLVAEDFAAWRRFFNGKRWLQKHVTVLYDGHCPLCRRSVFTLALMNWLHRLRFVNYHSQEARQQFPDLQLEDLNKAMHVVLPNGRTRKGYDGVAALAWHLPALWPAAPFMRLPGIWHVGSAVYNRVAASRHQCTDESCSHR